VDESIVLALVYKYDCVKLDIKIYNAFLGPSHREALSCSSVSMYIKSGMEYI
jgi:hypothetical protein